MKRKLVTKDDIIELLIKKANGFYYTEEQVEYEKNNSKNSNLQVDMFGDFQESKNAKLTTKILKNNENIPFFDKNYIENAKIDTNIERVDDKNNSKSKKCVTVSSNFDKFDDMIELSSKTEDAEHIGLILTKKKVSRHYVPPDMVAIKILFEIFGEKVDENTIETMSDDELLKLKNQLLEELKNEDIKNT